MNRLLLLLSFVFVLPSCEDTVTYEHVTTFSLRNRTNHLMVVTYRTDKGNDSVTISPMDSSSMVTRMKKTHKVLRFSHFRPMSMEVDACRVYNLRDTSTGEYAMYGDTRLDSVFQRKLYTYAERGEGRTFNFRFELTYDDTLAGVLKHDPSMLQRFADYYGR